MNITSHLPQYATTLGGAPTSDQRQTQTDVNKPTEERITTAAELWVTQVVIIKIVHDFNTLFNLILIDSCIECS